MKTVNCEGVDYLAHESEGNAARWIMPMAQYYCKGRGLDIGFSKLEWKMPNAIGIDPSHSGGVQHAMNLMNDNDGGQWDYIFSSHMLEHFTGNWMTCLDYWLTKIKTGGIVFLYLPHSSQRYWHPRNNRKHIHSFSGDEIGEYLKGLGHQTFVSGVDMNHSFCVICEKREIEPEFGSKEYYDKKVKACADEKELYCKERGISYIRSGDNVIYNEPTNAIICGVIDDKSVKQYWDKIGPNLDDEISDMRLKSEKQINSEIDESIGRFCKEIKSYPASTYEAWIDFNKPRENSFQDNVPFDIWIKYIANV